MREAMDVGGMVSAMQRFSYHSLDSTNEQAKRLLESGEIEDVAFITTREQLAGRGTRGRSWSSPKDAGLYLSVVHRRPFRPARETTQFTLSAGIACVDVLGDLANIEVGLKPVNDLYVDGRKLGGILTESIVVGDEMTALITGIGINIRTASREVEEGAVEPVCLEELGFVVEASPGVMDGLALEVAKRVDLWHRKVFEGRFEEIQDAWHLRAVNRGTPTATDTRVRGTSRERSNE